MKSQDKAFLHVLLHHSSRGGSLLRYFPEDLSDEMQRWPSPLAYNFQKILSQHDWLNSIHFSWFIAPLSTLSLETKQLFLSLLEKQQAMQLSRKLEVGLKPPSYSPFIRPFLMEELKKKIFQGVEVIDKDYLPPSELNDLLTLSKNQFMNLVDLLGVYDLSADLRQIVEKELLSKIYHSLSNEQLQFLHYCSRQPVKWISPKIGLASWDGSKGILQRILHGRGLYRLARALFDEDESLKWRLIHQLDIGRAKVMEKVFRQKQDPFLIPYFKNQVLHIAKRYKK